MEHQSHSLIAAAAAALWRRPITIQLLRDVWYSSVAADSSLGIVFARPLAFLHGSSY